MEDVISLIRHLLTTRHSIDRLDFIVKETNISKERLFQLINETPYREYFQLLRPSPHYARGTDKLALTLDLFCCTHYAQVCKNAHCPFLHLCPYNIRPMYTRCTNKACSYDHDISKSAHNRKIIDGRGLSFIPADTLHELVRASADASRSFWVCTDHGKKGGCPRKAHCDRLHYCYYALIDACTKPHCQHVITDACLTYFRQKELIEQDHDDILNAFSKVLRQRKPDFLNATNAPHQTVSASSSPKISNAGPNQRKSAGNHQQQQRSSSSSQRSTPVASASALSSYDDILSSKPDSSPPLPEHEQDILLLDSYGKDDYTQVERYLSKEISCPVKLLIVKNIFSERKESQSSNIRTKPTYYYCPIRNPADVFRLLRWQNEDKRLIKPLIVHASVNDAHNAAAQNFETNQFCIFRVHLLQTGVVNETLLPDSRLQLSDPQAMCFDRMWVYIYDL